jgi:hypothetical protein
MVGPGGRAALSYPTRTLMIEMTTNAMARKIVNWNRVFSIPRRVRTVDEAEPNKPPPPSLTCRRIITTNRMETSNCTRFMKSFMD